MIKKIILSCLLTLHCFSHTVQLGPNLLANSPSDYLLDLELFINTPEITQQIGNELFKRNFLNEITTYDEIEDSAAKRPADPGYGYTFDEGQWLWIPDSFNSSNGTWYWIIKPHSYYEAFFVAPL